jgi:hypothetical protein
MKAHAAAIFALRSKMLVLRRKNQTRSTPRLSLMQLVFGLPDLSLSDALVAIMSAMNVTSIRCSSARGKVFAVHPIVSAGRRRERSTYRQYQHIHAPRHVLDDCGCI